ncbi:MAG: hypothetical protein F4206_04445 [Gammaproteobacteria bacterium]|nr:hypothetical protein [Gammaproteobacteria bacterium]MYG65967.1 hypothetical protein [Gammaproteobacteria bacterium]
MNNKTLIIVLALVLGPVALWASEDTIDLPSESAHGSWSPSENILNECSRGCMHERHLHGQRPISPYSVLCLVRAMRSHTPICLSQNVEGSQATNERYYSQVWDYIEEAKDSGDWWTAKEGASKVRSMILKRQADEAQRQRDEQRRISEEYNRLWGIETNRQLEAKRECGNKPYDPSGEYQANKRACEEAIRIEAYRWDRDIGCGIYKVNCQDFDEASEKYEKERRERVRKNIEELRRNARAAEGRRRTEEEAFREAERRKEERRAELQRQKEERERAFHACVDALPDRHDLKSIRECGKQVHGN